MSALGFCCELRRAWNEAKFCYFTALIIVTVCTISFSVFFNYSFSNECPPSYSSVSEDQTISLCHKAYINSYLQKTLLFNIVQDLLQEISGPYTWI